MTDQEKLEFLRAEIAAQGLDGYILPRTDEFQGEFLAPYAERLAWLTGFTGSAGAVIILKDKAVVMSDGRYTIQLEQQVNQALYDRADSTKVTIGDWLKENAGQGSQIGYDPWLMTPSQIKKIQEHDIELVQIEENLIDKIWADQPKKPTAAITKFPDDIAGKTSAEKRKEIAATIDADAHLITAGDSICWLLNTRGGDIDYAPLIHSYALLYKDGSVDWFLSNRHPCESRDLSAITLDPDIRTFPMDNMPTRLKGKTIARDPKTCAVWFNQFETVDAPDPCALPKSIKTSEEQEAIRQAHIHDGVAVTKFLKWLEETDEPLTELSVEEKLESFRRECPDYIGPSFSTIAGFASNGAIIHYRATEKTNKTIKGNGLLLIDSGGQYRWGTTDITRTIAIGTPSQEMRENYTRVLKGHIAVATARFPKGTKGKDIDALARKPLQEAGLDFAHGTGHGVGCYLNVHEWAANLSPKGEEELKPGMLLSNEPGYYKEGEYGIRIENLVLVQEDEKEQLYFENVTRAPYDQRLIKEDMLTDQEKDWLKNHS